KMPTNWLCSLRRASSMSGGPWSAPFWPQGSLSLPPPGSFHAIRISLYVGSTRFGTASDLGSGRGRDSMYPLGPWQQNARQCGESRERLRFEPHGELDASIVRRFLGQHRADTVQPGACFSFARGEPDARRRRIDPEPFGDRFAQVIDAVAAMRA